MFRSQQVQTPRPKRESREGDEKSVVLPLPRKNSVTRIVTVGVLSLPTSAPTFNVSDPVDGTDVGDVTKINR